VQDAKHTGLICVSSGLIYLVAGLISVKSFFTLIVICLFSLPVTYERHEQWINEKAELYMAKLHQAVEKYGSPSYNQAIDLYQQAGMLFLESMKKLPKSVSK
jgi:hypothetical protein